MSGALPPSLYLPQSTPAVRRRSGNWTKETGRRHPTGTDDAGIIVSRVSGQEFAVRRLPSTCATLEPTIQLVQKKDAAPSPNLPMNDIPDGRTIGTVGPHAWPRGSVYVPLSPRPEVWNRSSTQSSQQTQGSYISRLPTPNFPSRRDQTPPESSVPMPSCVLDNFKHDYFSASHGQDAGSRSISMHTAVESASNIFMRRLSLFSSNSKGPAGHKSSGMHNVTSSATGTHAPTRVQGAMYKVMADQRPHSSRACSNAASASSGQTERSAVSIDSGRSSLIPEARATFKLTHRWPRPWATVKYSGRAWTEKYLTTTAAGDSSLGTNDFNLFSVGRMEGWTIHKWLLMASVMSLFTYSTLGMIYSVLTWYEAWTHANVMLVADNDILVLITLCSSIMAFTSLVGLSGALLNSRRTLAMYALLLWPCLVSLLSIGYIAYKRTTFNLAGKLNLAWSESFHDFERLVIQWSLGCCGYYDSTHEMVPSSQCYARSPLPGCKASLMRFARQNLTQLWTRVFSIVPLHLLNIIISLLCANHVTRTFGKGVMPKKYRLTADDVRADERTLLQYFAQAAAKRPPLSRAASSTVYVKDDRSCLLPRRSESAQTVRIVSSRTKHAPEEKRTWA